MPEKFYYNGKYQDSPEPTVTIPEFARESTSIRPSQPERVSGRLVATPKPPGTRYPTAEDFGYVAPTYAPKPAESTLAELADQLTKVEADLNAARERFEAEQNAPDTRIADLTAEIERFRVELAAKVQALADLKAEGTPLDKISRAIDRAEKSVSGIANATIQSATNRDCLRVFEVDAKFLPKASLHGLRVKHEMKLRQYLPQAFIQLKGDTLDAQGV